jgi:hypothetical protein
MTACTAAMETSTCVAGVLLKENIAWILLISFAKLILRLFRTRIGKRVQLDTRVLTRREGERNFHNRINTGTIKTQNFDRLIKDLIQ